MRTIRDCVVAVTGGAGFLGSHLVEHLIEDRGCGVVVLDNLVAGRREFVHEDAYFVYCDIVQSEEFIKKVFQRYGVKYVFSYAAWPYIPDSFQRPKHVFEVNATGAINVINAAQEAGVEGILQVSSAEIYGGPSSPSECTSLQIDEDFRVAPHSTYGAAKAAVDYYCQATWRERKTPVIALRQFNCLGERETHPYIVPEIISQLDKILRPLWCRSCRGSVESKEYVQFGDCQKCGKHSNQLVPVRGDGVVKLGNDSFRDFLYAGDAVRIAVDLLETGQFGECYNLGSEAGIKMYDLARLIGKLMGFSEVRVEVDESRKRPWEIWHLQSDNTKLRTCLDSLYGARKFSFSKNDLTPLEEVLKKTIAYYEQNGRKWCWED